MLKHNLNPAQKQAVEYISGPLLIVAGAGTGKTTVITQKIAYLTENKLARPEEILALTFTEKAAQEMEERVNANYSEMQISTFHSFCQKILREKGMDIGINSEFKLLTDTQAWILVRQNLLKFDLDYYRPLGNPTRHIYELIRHFSKCKDELISPEEYLKYAQDVHLDNDKADSNEKNRLLEIANAYHVYNQLLLDNNSLDFGDLIFYANKLLKERAQILDSLRKRFKFILVDEFQDVNWAQYQLVRLLGKGGLTVVGDDDQSIYAFRGASVSNILRFKEDYPDAKEIVLTENYRSGQAILDLAYKSIQNNNPDRLEAKLNIDKKLKAEISSQSDFEYNNCSNINEEVDYIIHKICEIREQELAGWDDIAILVRTNSQAEPFMDGLEKAGIPYEFLAASGLYRQPIVLDCFNFLKAINAYHESSAVYRLLRLPFFKLTESDLQKVLYSAKKKSLSYYEILKKTEELDITQSGKQICNRVVSLIQKESKQAQEEKISTVLVNFLNNSGYLTYLAKCELEQKNEITRQIGYLREFIDFIRQYEITTPEADLNNFLEYFNSVLEAGDEGSMKQIGDTSDSVNILTVHRAKGLEFKYVFIVNLTEEKFPTRRHGEGIELPLALIKEKLPEGDFHYQEERRLFYVAVTRAQKKLFLTSACDYGGKRKVKLSRFLSELGFEQKICSESASSLSQIVSSASKQENTVKQAINYEISDTFSYSQLNAYSRCPYQYKLAYLLHLPAKGSASLSFGQTMHNALLKFYRRLQELNSVQQSSLFSSPVTEQPTVIRTPKSEELLDFYNQCWINDWYQSKWQKEEMHKKGKEILKTFYELAEKNWIIPANLESWFKIKIKDFYIHGRIDRIDKLSDGTLEIIDYKTGPSKETLTSGDKNQLLLYQMAVQALPEYKNLGKISKLTFYYLNDNSRVSFLGSEADLKKMEERTLEIINSIKNGCFKANPGNHTCAKCDFRDICEFRLL